MNTKHILTFIVITCLSTAYANCIDTFLACGHADAPVTQAEFSPDGTIIALCHNNGTVSICDSNGSELSRLQYDKSQITTFAFAPNSHLIALGAADGYIEIREINLIDKTIIKFKAMNNPYGDQPVTSMAFKDDASLYIAYGQTKQCKENILLYEIFQNNGRKLLSANRSPVQKIQCSPSGKSLYITEDIDIRRHTLENEIAPELLEGCTGFGVSNICTDFSKINENKFVEVSVDGIIRVGEFGKMDWLTILFDENAVYAQFSPVDDSLLLVATAWQKLSQDKRSNIKLIRLGLDNNEKHQVIEFPNHDRILTSARFNHDGTKIIGITLNGPAMIFNTPVLTKSWGETLSDVPSKIYKNCLIS